MKTRYITFILLLCALGLSGCRNFLDKSPELDLTDEDIYTSSDRMLEAVKGVYSQLKSFIGSKSYVSIENIGDDMINVSGNGYEALAAYEMNVGTETQENYEAWEAAYTAINSANTVMTNIEGHKDVAGTNYNRYIAELKFCRALSYYYLNMLYAQPYILDQSAKAIPLRLVAENSVANNSLSRSTVTAIFNQILSDTENYSNLPNTGATYDGITRASQAADLMLQMRVYMAMQNWDKAIEAGLAISGYSLSSDVAEPFKSSSSCSESIFSFPMATTNNGGGMQESVPYFYYSGNSLVLDRTSGICSSLYPNYDLAQDARISELAGIANGRPILKKFTDGQNYLDWVPIFRYAETLLNLAECYSMKGDDVDARTYLEKVRHRSIPLSSDPLDISLLSGESLKQAIFLERRAEFVGEAIRTLDIHRRGENYDKRKNTTSEFIITPTTNGYIWPIPNVELANNDSIK